MPTDQPLDPAAEARIREACPGGHGGGYCVCDRIRAAIRADREAREKLIPEPTQENLRMSAYYYSFDPTGDGLVDRILSAVACAGKGYHHTEAWGDNHEDCAPFRGGSYIAWIQNAARDVAHARNAERAHADALAEALVDAANEMHSYGLVADHWLHGKQVPLSECGYALCVAANEVLAAHDKRRGK